MTEPTSARAEAFRRLREIIGDGAFGVRVGFIEIDAPDVLKLSAVIGAADSLHDMIAEPIGPDELDMVFKQAAIYKQLRWPKAPELEQPLQDRITAHLRNMHEALTESSPDVDQIIASVAEAIAKEVPNE